MEDVHSERMEQNRLRRCHIYYFLEDDSMMVVEPSVSNSGIPHGKFDIYYIRRFNMARGQKDSRNDILPNNIQDLVEN